MNCVIRGRISKMLEILSAVTGERMNSVERGEIMEISKGIASSIHLSKFRKASSREVIPRRFNFGF